jgi:hypothetical protein
MEGEGSPVIDIVCDTSKALLPEASTTSSSSDSTSGGAARDVAEAGAGDTIDPRELAHPAIVISKIFCQRFRS